ncbi:nuclease-related domain-containing protein [Streptomyces sp. NBRC 109706]|uniref:nuclease-related domain-containing protein n=1 Tax=Streptomyces sp. NBRC 109706 TaxID=1550035 RepID=UPI0007829A59|nr:nuclease-related domain-containing protein [Streptomyces sp. NBRC 109706]
MGEFLLVALLFLLVAGLASWTAGGSRKRRRPASPRGPRRRPPVAGPRPPLTAEESAGQEARHRAGDVGERRTALLLGELGTEWSVLHDRALPRGRANIDHLLITPAAAVINVDSKMWSAKSGNVHERNGRVFHGVVDRTGSVEAARYESNQAALALGRPVATVIAVHRARITGGQITLPGVLIVPAHDLVALVRQIDHAIGPANPSLARLLPPYPGHP